VGTDIRYIPAFVFNVMFGAMPNANTKLSQRCDGKEIFPLCFIFKEYFYYDKF